MLYVVKECCFLCCLLQKFSIVLRKRENFKACLYEDTRGMLSLYEASFLSIAGENILEEARNFSNEHLKEYVNQNKDKNLAAMASHSLTYIEADKT